LAILCKSTRLRFRVLFEYTVAKLETDTTVSGSLVCSRHQKSDVQKTSSIEGAKIEVK